MKCVINLQVLCMKKRNFVFHTKSLFFSMHIYACIKLYIYIQSPTTYMPSLLSVKINICTTLLLTIVINSKYVSHAFWWYRCVHIYIYKVCVCACACMWLSMHPFKYTKYVSTLTTHTHTHTNTRQSFVWFIKNNNNHYMWIYDCVFWQQT